jgi:hypothetical protein
LLIYLDAMVTQNIADNLDYIMYLGGYLALEEVNQSKMPRGNPKYLMEIDALGRLAFLEQLGNEMLGILDPSPAAAGSGKHACLFCETSA